MHTEEWHLHTEEWHFHTEEWYPVTMSSSSEAVDVTSCLLATGGFDNQIRLWRVDNGSCHRTYPHMQSVGWRPLPVSSWLASCADLARTPCSK
jgi:hypothetical protein